MFTVLTVLLFPVFRVTPFLLFGWVLCLMMFVNCLLKNVVFCLFVIAVLLLKRIVVLGCVLGFLLERPARVFHSMCELVLWSQLSTRCSFQSSVLCCWICLSISAFRVGRVGSEGFCCLMVFRLDIRSRMFCGRSLCLLCCLPLGMLCLSAVSIMFVRMVLAWWGFWGGSMSVRAISISSVKSFQSAL